MKALIKIAAVAMILSGLPAKALAQTENPVEVLMKRGATEVMQTYITKMMGEHYEFIDVQLPGDSIAYEGEKEMMQKLNVSVPGMLQRRIVKFDVQGEDADHRGQVACDTDFRRQDQETLWIFFYGCKYSNPLIQKDWETSMYGTMPIRTLWNTVKMTPEEQALLK